MLRILLIILLLTQTTLHAAPKADLWSYWTANNPKSTKSINHSTWTALLKKYIHTTQSGLNLFAYGQVSKKDKQRLQHYIGYLESRKISSYNRNQQEAYWINLYNAETIIVILQHYPTQSILKINISPGWFSRGPWDAKLLTIEQHKVSLNDIEHRILRPIWHDNRIHYAVNCASIGCPNLQNKAYTANQLNSMLNSAAIDYVNSPRGVRIDHNRLVVSKIYQWYQTDFGNNDAQVIKHLQKYARPTLRQQLAKLKKISGYEYNWDLNQYPLRP